MVGFLVVGMLVSPGLGSALAEASDVLGGQGGKFWLLLTPVGELTNQRSINVDVGAIRANTVAKNV